MNIRPQIVVTGMGAVTPLGVGVQPSWSRLLAGRSGLRRLPEALCAGLDAKVGGLVPTIDEDATAGFCEESVVSRNERKKMDRFIVLALAATAQALDQAGWYPQTAQVQEQTATVIGCGIGGIPGMAHAFRTSALRGPRRLSPFTVPSFLVNMAASHVSIKYGFKGPIGAPVTACAASVQAIGDAARLIACGEATVAVCGGTEACMDLLTQGAFAAARALSTNFSDDPQRASRPFDIKRDGFVASEGAGIVVLEELQHALARGAVPLAELVGYGTCADAHHITAGAHDGSGAARAMRMALRQAQLMPQDVHHINAHATSTMLGDAAELTAIRSVFGAGSAHGPTQGPLISATKSATGHLLGAAGAIEAIFTVMALRDQLAPPTLNLDEPDALTQGLQIVGKAARAARMEHALSNSCGFGGVNASLLFRKWGGTRSAYR